ncbi:cell division protein FtsQ/DivIB [Aliifodinibius sp. S!AR15-10]|uniref:cell division protein FtsQ/DivIB n=1 Tax=Aliifodinibius sp. S!AR15-10 TaxID=2950437 RepID=UPI002857B921|nr:cell division protein FtsQ/DivIB [Aliifodinibius sp. S!AR15-10]MDR8393889.1 cell division protein FtsQ/DivIB [Aliifodinibius sp. S!AR15-10]
MTEQKESHSENPAEPSGFNAMPWLMGALFVLGVAILAGIYWNRTVVIQDVQFSGHNFITEGELAGKANVPTGVSPDSVDFMSIINQLETLPYVKQAAVNVEPSGDLRIQVTERRPIAMLADGDAKIYVDEEGIRLPLKLEKSVDVPIVYGFKTAPMSDTLKSDAWVQTQSFLKEINGSSFNHATISEIAWTKKEGIVALSHENGVKLVFGKDKFRRKLRNWKAFYSEVVRTKGIDKMRTVDLRFKGQIVTRES